MEWISVKERLPEERRRVFVHGSNNYNDEKRMIGQYWGDGRWLCMGRGQIAVTHWQPLPDPPKGE